MAFDKLNISNMLGYWTFGHAFELQKSLYFFRLRK